MAKKLLTSGFLLLILLIVTVTLSAEERLKASRVDNNFNKALPMETWTQKTSVYDYSLSGNLNLRLFAGYDQNFLYFGFYVKDSFLTFQDDFSLDFRGSDHLRVSFLPKGSNPVTLYLLPSSKIKEPLLNITGASWRQTSVTMWSVPGQQGYFLTVAIDLSNLGFSPWQRELPFQIRVYDVSSQGKAKIHRLFGAKPQDYGTLVLSN